ncbi:MAG: trypsin-like peptidase domain-containing protein [Actinomycetota bacterium]
MRARALWLILATALLAAACGGGGDSDSGEEVTTGGEEPAATTAAAEDGGEEPAATTAAEGGDTSSGGGITDVSEVRSAVVQIVAQGSFIDPEAGAQLNAAGAGSGFIISESGLAVTNNHVVTGAATLEVFVEGESRNASLVASSECSDLAVIDIEGDGFPFLEWYDDPIDVGLDVFAAGFPLGDPEFTLTRGIVSKAQADGDSEWASVDAVIEHDANINPGNSGGPLVSDDGRVVAVNYAGIRGTGQFFAIGQDTALEVVDQLSAGNYVDWIGINGQAIVFDDGTSGVWVAAVESGSPASQVGLQAGDIITAMEGLLVGTDGTLKDYCDILRTRGDNAVAIEVLRLSTEEFLEGELNGAPLAQSFSFAAELGTETPDAPGGSYEYTVITDDTGLLSVEVPTAWSQVDGRPIDDLTLDVRAADSLQDYADFYDTPGVQFTVTADAARVGTPTDAVLDSITTWSSGCSLVERAPYDDGLYVGSYDFFTDCGGAAGVGAVVVAALPPDGAYLAVVAVQVVSDADLEAMDRILSSFFVTLE